MIAFIALGSNLGDRAAALLSAVRQLNATPGVRVRRLSTFHETDPVGGPPDQPRFLNAAAELDTDLSPEALLRVLLEVEAAHGRTRCEKDGPRTLDLDLLLYGDLVRAAPDPIVPHPRMHKRRFVLEPLAEVAPDVVHPQLGRSTRELLSLLPHLSPDSVPGKDDGDDGVEQLAKEPTRFSSTHPAPSAHLPRQGGDARHEGRPLTGLRTLVTGSTAGIGRAMALAFARAGADVMVHGRRPGDAVTAEIAEHGVRTQALRADLCDLNATAALADRSWTAWGGLDVVVLNAGADVLTGDAAKWPFECKLAELLAVDVTATMLLGRAFGERMRHAGRGVILTVGWDQAETGMDGDSGQLFAASKAAVMAFTRSLAVSLAPAVRVNCLALGWIRTAWGESASAVWQERVRRETPLGRWGTPEDVAAAAVWLASPAAAFVTGQTIRINGGAVR